jgi:tetratricopeptide (TPR) repeat protein
VCAAAAGDAPTDDERAAALAEGARCLAAVGEFERAEAELARARLLSAAAATQTEINLVAADMALARLRFADAERFLASAFELAGRGSAAAAVALQHAELQFLRGNFRQAIAEVGRVLEQLPGDDLQARALVLLARALLEQGQPDPVGADLAISRAALIVHHKGTAAVVRATHALVQAHCDNASEAEEAAREAPGLTESPRWAAEAHCAVGDALRRLGRFADARASYQTALTLDPDMPGALWGLGSCAQALGMFEVAEAYFTLCMETAPEHYLAQRSEAAIEQS